MKTSLATAFGTASLLFAGVVLGQSGNMMNGDSGMWGGDWMGGYGGIWGPVLLVIVIAAVVALFLQRKGK